MKLHLMLDLPTPPSPQETALHRGPSLEQRVEHAINLCDSGHPSEDEWQFLIRVNNGLMKLDKLNQKQKDLLKKIRPILEKHGSQSGGKIDSDSTKLSEAGSLFNWKDK